MGRGAAGVAAGTCAGAGAAPTGAGLLDQLATPPWLEHAPMREVPLYVEPSLQMAESVTAGTAWAGFFAAGFAVSLDAAGVGAAGGVWVAGFGPYQVLTPPWLEHAPCSDFAFEYEPSVHCAVASAGALACAADVRSSAAEMAIGTSDFMVWSPGGRC